MEQNSSQKQMKARDVVDSLVNDLTDLKINNNTSSSKCCVAAAAKKSSVKVDGSGTREAAISPADYISMQSLQSSMKANKMNTTIKVSRHNLMADLLSFNDEPVEVVEKNEPKETESWKKKLK
uniref:Uncharacterized protein n=1 Tax=Ditylenchus dipsaci TaxID=166011 RepID=A0A915CRP2_9BILA